MVKRLKTPLFGDAVTSFLRTCEPLEAVGTILSMGIELAVVHLFVEGRTFLGPIRVEALLADSAPAYGGLGRLVGEKLVFEAIFDYK